MSTFLQFLFGGLLAGAVFALIALGWTLIYNVSGILNLAQGEFVMVGAMVFIELRVERDMPVGLAVVLAIAITVTIGVLLDVVVLRRIPPTQLIPMILATVGASIVLRELASEVFGKDPLRVPPLVTGAPITIGGATVLPHTLLIWATVAVLLIALTLYFTATLFGKAMRACSENPVGARTVGISTMRMRTISFAMSAGLGAIAGILIVPITSMSWDGGTVLGIKGFIAAVFGGMGSYVGAVVGGLLLGVLEAMGAGYVSSAYKDVFALSSLVALLLFRPQGLLGRSSSEQAGLLRSITRHITRPQTDRRDAGRTRRSEEDDQNDPDPHEAEPQAGVAQVAPVDGAGVGDDVGGSSVRGR